MINILKHNTKVIKKNMKEKEKDPNLMDPTNKLT